ncbi:MAG: hypothetical protein H6553_08645 [Chitinophagales bacterium]|nr:hypothetical protein [Chitinophagales bacterium]
MHPQFQFKTAQGILLLRCTHIVEPNNGRMLYEVTLTLNNTDVTQKYFDNWQCINFNLSAYEGQSNDYPFIYIPKETHHFLINTNTLEKIDLPSLYLSTVNFISNQFNNQYLTIHSINEVQIVDLKQLTTKVIKI